MSACRVRAVGPLLQALQDVSVARGSQDRRRRPGRIGRRCTDTRASCTHPPADTERSGRTRRARPGCAEARSRSPPGWCTASGSSREPARNRRRSGSSSRRQAPFWTPRTTPTPEALAHPRPAGPPACTRTTRERTARAARSASDEGSRDRHGRAAYASVRQEDGAAAMQASRDGDGATPASGAARLRGGSPSSRTSPSISAPDASRATAPTSCGGGPRFGRARSREACREADQRSACATGVTMPVR